jgi:hypothetical protein
MLGSLQSEPRKALTRKSYRALLSDADVRRWHQNVQRGSEVTADVYLRRLGHFCTTNYLEPASLLRLDEKALSDILLDNVTRLEKEGHTGSYIKSIMKAVKSWLRHNHITLTSTIKIKDENSTPTLQEERVPTPAELGNILRSGGHDARVAVSLMAFSGLRPEVLGNYRGTDGLRLADLPELEIDNEKGSVDFKASPAFIVARGPLSKAGHQYLTLLSEEGCLYLKEYLEARMRDGERLTASSTVLKPRYADKAFIRSSNVSDKVRAAIRAAGFQWRPYVLRCFFDTRLLLAESNRLIIRDYRVFWMGHKGDIEQLYTLNKHVLPADLLEEMREAYRKSQRFLQTAEASGKREEDINLAFKRELLLIAGYRQEELSSLNLVKMDDDEIHRRCRERLLGILANNGSRQRVVPLRQVERFLVEGWEYVDRLPNRKAIVRLPAV